MKFLESENVNLSGENNDIVETLKINKQIIATFMS
jgi:hypothetical protein